MANVVTANPNGLDFTKKKWAAEHLSQRIEAAIYDPNVDMVAFLGLLQTYNQQLMTLKRGRSASKQAA
ncbi:MAG TPA: hypothetical protein VKP65_09450 [Rhodothermales bacterium]|nr:hypothetical protein [Rhodothermales bacterium]